MSIALALTWMSMDLSLAFPMTTMQTLKRWMMAGESVCGDKSQCHRATGVSDLMKALALIMMLCPTPNCVTKAILLDSQPTKTMGNTLQSVLMSYVYFYANSDKFFICGDFNARIGNLPAYIDGIDENIPKRGVVDKVINDHGNAFVELLQEANMCVINGRINHEANDFTCTSTRGCSVVDYIAVDFNTLKDCVNFEVMNSNNMLHVYNFQC